ncbi:hypothetical protein ABZP36_003818 [Zizania latifolia]
MTSRFLLAHHSNQRRLPLFSGSGANHNHFEPPDFFLYDPRASASEQILPFPRLDAIIGPATTICASCDGLLAISFAHFFFYVCNPTTSQFYHVNQVQGFGLLGLYPHRPTADEYHLLMYRQIPFDEPLSLHEPTCYVITLGGSNSQRQPRCIGWPAATAVTSSSSSSSMPTGGAIVSPRCLFETLLSSSSVLVHGNLHLYLSRQQVGVSDDGSRKIMVFDTLAESIHFMATPVVHPNPADLFEMDGTLRMYSWNIGEEIVVVNMWVMEDYAMGFWKFMCQVELPVAETIDKLEFVYLRVVVVTEEKDVCVMVNTNDGVLHYDTKGRLLANYNDDERRFFAARHTLKPSLVPHSFFSMGAAMQGAAE